MKFFSTQDISSIRPWRFWRIFNELKLFFAWLRKYCSKKDSNYIQTKFWYPWQFTLKSSDYPPLSVGRHTKCIMPFLCWAPYSIQRLYCLSPYWLKIDIGPIIVLLLGPVMDLFHLIIIWRIMKQKYVLTFRVSLPYWAEKQLILHSILISTVICSTLTSRRLKNLYYYEQYRLHAYFWSHIPEGAETSFLPKTKVSLNLTVTYWSSHFFLLLVF